MKMASFTAQVTKEQLPLGMLCGLHWDSSQRAASTDTQEKMPPGELRRQKATERQISCI